jgi:hypothetical protein
MMSLPLNYLKPTTMNLQAEKLELMRLILETESESVVKAMKEMLVGTQADDAVWRSLPETHREEILEGLKEVEQGMVVDYQQFMKAHR